LKHVLIKVLYGWIGLDYYWKRTLRFSKVNGREMERESKVPNWKEKEENWVDALSASCACDNGLAYDKSFKVGARDTFDGFGIMVNGKNGFLLIDTILGWTCNEWLQGMLISFTKHLVVFEHITDIVLFIQIQNSTEKKKIKNHCSLQSGGWE